MSVGKCANCGHRKDTTHVQRFGGGTYRRAGRWYNTQVCEECAERLLAQATAGHRTTSRFSVFSLGQAVRRFKGQEATSEA